MNWSILRQELQFQKADEHSVSLWAQNYQELYGDGSTRRDSRPAEIENCYGIISKHGCGIYSHPLLEKEIGRLVLGTLLNLRRFSVSGKWVLVTSENRQKVRGWVHIDCITLLDKEEFEYLKSCPQERASFLLGQQ